MKAMNSVYRHIVMKLGPPLVAGVVASVTMTTPMATGSDQDESLNSTSRAGDDMVAQQIKRMGLMPAEAAALRNLVVKFIADTGGTLPSQPELTFPTPGAAELQRNSEEAVNDCCDAYLYTSDPPPHGGHGIFEAYDEIIRACDQHGDGYWAWTAVEVDGSLVGTVADENGP
ncbi:MAG: hypothetical protein ACRD2X_12895, partial [Vicinamibacteraceae bacterium]